MTPASVAGVIPLVPVWRVDRVFDYVVPREMSDTVRLGSLVRVPFGGRRVRGVVVSVRQQIEEQQKQQKLESVLSVVFRPPVAPAPLDRLLEWIAERYVTPRGKAFALAVPPRVRVAAAPASPIHGGPDPRRVLAYESARGLLGAIEMRGAGTWCVQSLPGEDRTALIAELVAAAGRSRAGAAVVAVPEVRYGSVVLDDLATHWPEFARVDSAQPEMERARSWARLASGHGAGGGGRSAVLAPAPRLRLLIVDDEHHPTYKEDRAPRYDAVRVAVERARLQAAVCVLVSATPSVTLGAAAMKGDVGWLRPSRGESRSRRPIVELSERPQRGPLSRELHARVRDSLRRGDRVALLAASRGYARALWCAECRRSLRCPVCETGLFYDRSASIVRCIACDFRSAAPAACPSCSSTEWRMVGAGSERLAEQLASMFPRARVVRVDPEILVNRLPARAPRFDEADIYLTTWIGTKAALRPDVTLVGVLDADALIRRPDWHSAERAYQALAEMAEWAGPADSGGRLLIQTSEPGHHAVQAVARADYRFFLEREVEARRELGYPPFSELIRVTIWGPEEAAAVERLRAEVASQGVRVLGPMTVRRAPSRHSAKELLLKCPSAGAMSAVLKDLVVSLPRGTTVRVDTDPR
ncbi:MAG: primosomal protein N' [Actinomycetota bacterium]|nr:primosomal protein N' [Actinomycetota bacterium]